VTPLEARMAHLEGAYEQTAQRLAGFDLRFDALDRKIDGKIDALSAKVDGKIDALSAKVDRHFTWTVGLIFGTWAAAIATIFAALPRH
jgi:hypothetical protein